MRMYQVINRRTVLIVAGLFLLSTLDLFLTCYAINTGIAYEGNPIISRLTLQGIGLIKTIGLTALVYRFGTRLKILNRVALVLLLVCAWNIGVITGNI